MTEKRPGRRYHVTVRRTLVQTQQVTFIADNAQMTRAMQVAIAAGYARPEGWLDVKSETDIVDLSSETITWEQDS